MGTELTVSLLAAESSGEDCRSYGRLLPPCAVCSWRFTCTDLWDMCVYHSGNLQMPLVKASVLVHQISLFSVALETGLLYLDEIIIADTNLTGNQHICCLPWACLQILAFSCLIKIAVLLMRRGQVIFHLAHFCSESRWGENSHLWSFIFLASPSFSTYLLHFVSFLLVLVLLPQLFHLLARKFCFPHL